MLQFTDLKKRFGDVQALDGVTFSVPDSAITGFVGRNGAGKSTTMRSIFGLVQLDSGTISWNGHPVTNDDLPRFGFMPEQRGLYLKMPILEQVVYFARLKGMSSSAATKAGTEWLDRFGLGDRLKDHLENLSHGNQQRVQLCTAVVHDPDLIVLDEPFNGLDPTAVDMLQGQLRELTDTGKTVLLSSHQLDLVEEMCDRVVFINAGRVVADGSVAGVRRIGGRSDLEIDFTDTPDWDQLVTVGVTMTTTTSGRVPNTAEQDLPNLLHAAMTAGTISEFRYEPPSLAEVFAEVTK